MKEIFVITFFIIGTFIIFVGNLASFFKSKNDPSSDEFITIIGLHIFKYPKILLTIILGFIFILLAILIADDKISFIVDYFKALL